MATCTGTTRSTNSPAHTYSSPSNTATDGRTDEIICPQCYAYLHFPVVCCDHNHSLNPRPRKPRAAARPHGATDWKEDTNTDRSPPESHVQVGVTPGPFCLLEVCDLLHPIMLVGDWESPSFNGTFERGSKCMTRLKGTKAPCSRI